MERMHIDSNLASVNIVNNMYPHDADSEIEAIWKSE